MSDRSLKTSNKLPLIIAGALLILFAWVAVCSAAFYWLFIREQPEPPQEVRCPPLPKAFHESDLIGTWVASYNIYSTDTLIIREDGTYKQIFEDIVPKIDLYYRYESDWQEWWIETRPSGYLRLHLKGMRRFDDLTEVWEREGGGTISKTIDYCEYVEVKMPDEVVLIVTGVLDRQKNYQRGIMLRQTLLAGSDWYYSFKLQD